MLRDQVTITELELLCYLNKPRTVKQLTKFLQTQQTVANCMSRLNKKGLIDIENPHSPSVMYKVSNKGEAIIDKLDDLRFA